MKNIIVDNYLKINKELIGCSISLKKSSEISFFLEVCRIKQMEVLAKHNCYCNDFDKNLSINKSKFSNIFNSSTIRKNDRMFALESDGIFFSKVYMENVTIIESISFNANNGNFDVEFNESNFIKYFINCIDDNFIKVPTKMFSGLKSKNSSMILLWILKFQDVKGYKFIKPKDLCIILDKNINSIRKDNLKSDLNNALCQLKHIGIYDGTKSDFDKNGSLRLNISPFSVNINVESSTKKITKKDTRIPTENFSEDEIRIYGGCDE